MSFYFMKFFALVVVEKFAKTLTTYASDIINTFFLNGDHNSASFHELFSQCQLVKSLIKIEIKFISAISFFI